MVLLIAAGIAAGNGQCWPYTTPAAATAPAASRFNTTVTWNKVMLIMSL